MGKQWLYLIVLSFILMGFFVAWDLLVTLSGGRDVFAYNINPISNQLYGGLEEHFASSPDFAEYQAEAQQIQDLQYFAPPLIVEED